MSFGGRPKHNLQGSCWRHEKTGKVYWIVRVGKIEADLTEAVIYEDAMGNVWVRQLTEFMDGRFTPIRSGFASRENPCSEIPLGGSHVAPLSVSHE